MAEEGRKAVLCLARAGAEFKFKLFSAPKRQKKRQNSKIYGVAIIFEQIRGIFGGKNEQKSGFLHNILVHLMNV